MTPDFTVLNRASFPERRLTANYEVTGGGGIDLGFVRVSDHPPGDSKTPRPQIGRCTIGCSGRSVPKGAFE
jgi:hypothetical protein